MSLEREPFSAADAVNNQNLLEKKKLISAYKATFNTPSGKVVLADLKKAFGFDRSSFHYGQSHADIAGREGMKQPIYLIEKIIAQEPAKRRKTPKLKP